MWTLPEDIDVHVSGGLALIILVIAGMVVGWYIAEVIRWIYRLIRG